jgi:hypothetical protein
MIEKKDGAKHRGLCQRAAMIARILFLLLTYISSQPPVEQVKALRKQISEDFSKVE